MKRRVGTADAQGPYQSSRSGVDQRAEYSKVQPPSGTMQWASGHPNSELVKQKGEAKHVAQLGVGAEAWEGRQSAHQQGEKADSFN